MHTARRPEELLGCLKSSPASGRNPTYIIQPNSNEARREKLLLGENLNTTSLVLGKVLPRDNARRLHVKSDVPDGVSLPQITPRDLHDIWGSIGGERELREKLFAINNSFSCRVALAMVGEDDCIDIDLLARRAPTLVLSRSDLYHPEIAPQLRGSASNPGYGEIFLIDSTFRALIDKVRRHIDTYEYLFVDC